MLGEWRPHAEFQEFLIENLTSRWDTDRTRINLYATLIEAAWQLDLDSAKEVLAPFYSPHGRPSDQAPEVLRTLFLMTLAGETSMSRWCAQIQGEPILAISCGYDPQCTPGIATLYDFFHRFFWLGNVGPALRRPVKPLTLKPGTDQKLPHKRPGIVDRLLKQAEEGRRFKNRPEMVLQTLMAKIVVEPSAKKGLLGDPDKLRIAGDGAPLETGASSRGKRQCKCHLEGNYRCGCPRLYQDSEAGHGHDSYHKRPFYGHTLYHITAADSPNDLPIYVRLTQAQRHDSVTGFVCLVEVSDLYPKMAFRVALLDSAHDNAATYQLCYQAKMSPFIDANTRHTGKHKHPVPNDMTPEEVPICQAGQAMVHNGYNPGRCRTKWRCVCRSGFGKRVLFMFGFALRSGILHLPQRDKTRTTGSSRLRRVEERVQASYRRRALTEANAR